MTVCIAAIVNNSKIIAITDKMITLGGNVATRYEITESDKAIKLTDKCVALFAGNVISANEILTIAKTKITAACTDISQIAELMKESYFEYWQKILNNQLFQRYALSLVTFMQRQQTLNDDLVKQINGILANSNSGVDIVIAGVDTIPHLFYIGNPGTITSLDSVGYAIIGSGFQHAQLSLIESEYNAGISVQNGLYSLIEAKKRAEYDPGVGQLCDIVIIDDNFTKLLPEKVNNIMKEFVKSSNSIKQIKGRHAIKVHNLV